MTCKGTLRQVLHLFEAPSPPITPYSPLPFHIEYVCTVYGTYSHREGGGGGRGGANQRG
jgi:hypothetical protein